MVLLTVLLSNFTQLKAFRLTPGVLTPPLTGAALIFFNSNFKIYVIIYFIY